MYFMFPNSNSRLQTRTQTEYNPHHLLLKLTTTLNTRLPKSSTLPPPYTPTSSPCTCGTPHLASSTPTASHKPLLFSCTSPVARPIWPLRLQRPVTNLSSFLAP